ncbi:hypothetical protein [Streptomyces sp. H39-S7]|uniref:hypothetical protein n=1 Tax=Streptomyces sp. H39-S7 TaxID=3004357 RepID=UPI0022B054FB|nr:hypothetical protein [Streptomyces sp. H39-S7]MCZ4119690.1 hypothetical protein [Streptomyces sp. H39-S7]
MFAQTRVSGDTAVGSDGRSACTVDLTTGVRTALGSNQGRTRIEGISGKLVIGETYPTPTLAFAYRTDTRTTTLLPAAGGLVSVANGADRRGFVTGTAATTTDPDTVNSTYHAVLWTPHTG